MGSGSVSGLEGAVDGGSAAARGLEGAERPGAGTGGDLRGSGEVSGDLLPCGQLEVHGPDEGTQGECIGGRQDSEGRLPVSADERLEAGAADRLPSIRTPFPQAAGGGLGPGGCFCPALERHRRDARGGVANRHDRLWQQRRSVLNTLVVVLFIFRLVFSKGRPGYATTLAELWGQCRTMGIELPQPAPVSPSSICSARARLDEQLFKTLH